MNNLLAQINLAPGGGFTGPGKLGNPSDATAGSDFESVISTVIGVMTAIAFVWFTINFLIAAISWMTAGSDSKKVEGARTKLTNSLIGLVVTVAAIFLIDFIGKILGVDILNPTTILNL